MNKNQVGDTSDITDGARHARRVVRRHGVDKYVSAFPALEQDVITYNETDPKEPLVAVYPKTGSYDADHPYLILTNPTLGEAQGRGGTGAATAFEPYARSAERPRRLPEGRFPRLQPGRRHRVLTEANGVIAVARPVPAPRRAGAGLGQRHDAGWTARDPGDQRAARARRLRLDDRRRPTAPEDPPATRARRRPLEAVDEFSDDSNVGLWVFSDGYLGGKTLQGLVPLGHARRDHAGRQDRASRT